jgi:phosphate/sulfate permease
MISTLHLVFLVIGLALIFDIFNGFHDAANSVATVVTTRVLPPLQAVAWAAFFNFVAAFVFGTGVAKTVSDKLIDPKVVDVYVIIGGLVGAIVWDIITWLMLCPPALRTPSSADMREPQSPKLVSVRCYSRAGCRCLLFWSSLRSLA